ncbi:hypothetical protein KPL74_02445 [Bacillus sp. NP157]|nr:hypothetical protein KPL74_02445 [Bacillus sp. NP157]
MSTLRDTLVAQLRRFDDDAWAALANRGLLRRARKDLESGVLGAVVDDGTHIDVAIGGQRVVFDERGVAHASCDCRATGVCQHVLAAGIALAGEGDAVPPVAGEGLESELLGLSIATLVAHAGKPGYRQAWQFVDDLDLERGVTIESGRQLVVAFRTPRMAFRFVGGGLDGFVCDVQTSHLARYRVAAVLAFRRSRGVAIDPPEAKAPRTAALDLGRDHAVATTAGEARDDGRQRVVAAVSALASECLALGLAHLSDAVQQRFSTLATWAQACDFPRLALSLRRLADHVELLLERAGGADEHRLFDELALASALAEALGAALARGAEPAALMGRARTRYDASAPIDLVGMGASAWRTGTGYVGLTLLFWSPADRCFYGCTDARPATLRGFDPIARYRQPGPWNGLAAPSVATGKQLRLTHAEINAQGRLSAAPSTLASVQPIGLETLRASLAPVSAWDDLAPSGGHASLLAEARPMDAWRVLAPARAGALHFDETRQVLSWPLFDTTGAEVRIELAYAAQTQHAIDRLERMAAAGWPDGAWLVARVHPSRTGLVAQPLAVIGGRGASVDALYFDPAPDAEPVVARRHAHAATAAPSPGLPRPLRSFRDWLRSRAERGVAAADALALDGWQDRLGELGFSAIKALRRNPAPGVRWLRMNYACLQYERLLDASGGDEG